jgi:hypothetical protein
VIGGYGGKLEEFRDADCCASMRKGRCDAWGLLLLFFYCCVGT